jgi:hypothetical protein
MRQPRKGFKEECVEFVRPVAQRQLRYGVHAPSETTGSIIRSRRYSGHATDRRATCRDSTPRTCKRARRRRCRTHPRTCHRRTGRNHRSRCSRSSRRRAQSIRSRCCCLARRTRFRHCSPRSWCSDCRGHPGRSCHHHHHTPRRNSRLRRRREYCACRLSWGRRAPAAIASAWHMNCSLSPRTAFIAPQWPQFGSFRASARRKATRCY